MKGNFNFCQNIEELNEIIATQLNDIISPYIYNINLKSSLDDKKYIYIINSEENTIKEKEVINFSYIIENKEENNINNRKINIEIKYIKSDRNYNEKDKEVIENYEIIPEELPPGEELSKLIINDYILNNSNLNLNIDEKKKLALKYQLLTKYTSLFAEVELSNTINEEMKIIIIGNKENNQIKEIRPSNSSNYKSYNSNYERPPKRTGKVDFFPRVPKPVYGYKSKKAAFSLPSFDGILNSIKWLFSFGSKDTKKEIIEKQAETYKEKKEKKDNEISQEYKMNIKEEIKKEDLKEETKETKILENKINIKEEFEKEDLNVKIYLNNKENIMEMIATQDFIEGSWNINEKTKIIKKKYEKEFELLKNLKDKNIDDKIAITILIIYFINNEHSELLKELIMIIKKGKLFIQEKTKNYYENIINEIGL